MADFATPSAAAISSLDAGAEASTNGTSTPAASKPAGRPEKPDESVFKAAVEKARKALNDAQEYAVCLRNHHSSNSHHTLTNMY